MHMENLKVSGKLGLTSMLPHLILVLLYTSVQIQGHEAGDDVETTVDDRDVVVLNSANFEEVLSKTEHILVEFYAPWCSHCKQLEPIYAEIATSLKQQNSPVVIAKIDASEHEDIATKYDIQGFPTLKFFRNGIPIEYNGARSFSDILSWVKRKAGPPSMHLTTQLELEQFMELKGIKVVAYIPVDNADSAITEWKNSVTSPTLEDFNFAHITNVDLFDGHSPMSFSIYKLGEDVIHYNAPFESVSIVQFIQKEGFPLVRPLDQELWEFSQRTQQPLLALFIDEQVFDWNQVRPIAKYFKGKVIFSYHTSADLAGRWGASGNVIPTAIMVVWKEGQATLYVFNEETVFTGSSIDDFVTGALQGTYESFRKSEPIPTSNENYVFVLVGKQYEEIVYNKEKDVFVEFYAPWCGHCQQLAPVWEELGQRFAGHKDKITIAKMDATANSPDNKVQIESFPTLVLFPANNKVGITFEGERDLESMTGFILEHASNKHAFENIQKSHKTKEDL